MLRSRAPLRLALPLSFALTSGCGSEGAADPAAKPADAKAAAGASASTGAKVASGDQAATGAPAATGAETGSDAHVVKISDADIERLKLMGAEVAKHLESAKAAETSGDWPAAAKAYAEALKLDDDNPHILAALGWAQFNAKQLDAAEDALRNALRHERESGRRASVLYKLGRVEEERGDWVSAKAHYDHSLRIKDDAETRTHDETATLEAEKACKAGDCDKPDYPDLNAACAAMLERVHHQLGLMPGSAEDEFTCDPAKAKTIALEGGDATEAAILKISGEHGVVEEEEYDLLVHIEGGWHWVGTILDIENPHHDGILRSGALLNFEAKELLPDTPGLDILIEVELAESDADLDENLMYHDEHEAFIVCGVTNTSHSCHEIPTRMLWEAEAIDASRPTAHDTARHEFKATAEFDGKGNVTVTGAGEIPEAEKGTHAITELMEPEGFVFLHED